MSFRREVQIVLAFLFAIIVPTVLPGAVSAAEGWAYTVGAGVYGTTAYSGSDEYYLAPLPVVRASYAGGDAEFFLSLPEGLGVNYVNLESGVVGSIALAHGGERDSEEYSVLGIQRDYKERTKRLLRNSPNVSTPVSVKATIGYRTTRGTIGAALGYHPTEVEYVQNDHADSDHHGLLYSLFYSIERPVTEHLSYSAMLGVEIMNQGYADAWYSVAYETDELAPFKASAGLRGAKFSLQATRMFTAHTGVSLRGAGTFLLMDAQKSPYTVERFQPSMLVFAFYTF